MESVMVGGCFTDLFRSGEPNRAMGEILSKIGRIHSTGLAPIIAAIRSGVSL